MFLFVCFQNDHIYLGSGDSRILLRILRTLFCKEVAKNDDESPSSCTAQR